VIKRAYLVPLGVYGPLAGPRLSYPEQADPQADQEIEQEIHAVTSSRIQPIPQLLSSSRYLGQNPLAISLWSERGLIGLLILGDKLDASLYTQEEVDIARTVAERLIDSMATNELTQRLMQLERQHLSETRVVDQQTRRTLHDEILPRIQSLMIKMSGAQAKNDEALQQLGDIHHQLSELMRNLPVLQDPELERLGLVLAFKRSVEHEFKPYFDKVTWQVDAGFDENTRMISPYALNVVYHAGREAVRNAAHHGQPPASDQLINLSISMIWKEGLILKIVDDGVGFDPGIKIIQGDGHGMSLHSTLMAIVGGAITWESSPGKFTLVTISLPARSLAQMGN
jgi:signal transduction histidine kinase